MLLCLIALGWQRPDLACKICWLFFSKSLIPKRKTEFEEEQKSLRKGSWWGVAAHSYEEELLLVWRQGQVPRSQGRVVPWFSPKEAEDSPGGGVVMCVGRRNCRTGAHSFHKDPHVSRRCGISWELLAVTNHWGLGWWGVGETSDPTAKAPHLSGHQSLVQPREGEGSLTTTKIKCPGSSELL